MPDQEVPMHESMYIGEPGVPPVRIVTLQGLRKLAKRGHYNEAPVWSDLFEMEPGERRW